MFVLGHSLGGMLAPRIAAGDPSIAGLILMGFGCVLIGEMVLKVLGLA